MWCLFFFSLIRDNDYLAPRNQRIKEKSLVQHVERTFQNNNNNNNNNKIFSKRNIFSTWSSFVRVFQSTWQLFQDWTKRVRRRKVAAQDYRFLTYQLHSPQLSILLAEVAVTAKNHFHLMKLFCLTGSNFFLSLFLTTAIKGWAILPWQFLLFFFSKIFPLSKADFSFFFFSSRWGRDNSVLLDEGC